MVLKTTLYLGFERTYNVVKKERVVEPLKRSKNTFLVKIWL